MKKYIKILIPLIIIILILVTIFLIINNIKNNQNSHNNEIQNSVNISDIYIENENYKEGTNKTEENGYMMAEGYESYSKEISFYNKKAKIIYFRYNENSDFANLVKNTIKVEICDIENDLELEINNFNNYCINSVKYDGELISAVYFKEESNEEEIYTNLKNDKIIYYFTFNNDDKYYEITYYNENAKLIGEFSYNGINENYTKPNNNDSIGEL